MWTVFGDNGEIYEIENVRINKYPLFLTEMGCGVSEMTADIVNVRRTDKKTWFSAYHLTPLRGFPSAIKKVIFNDPATIVLWNDGTKTVVKCQDGDEYSKEQGLALCIAKKHLGNKSNFNNEFKRWINERDHH